MIKQLDSSEFPRAAEVIRESFATVAKDFGFTEQNFPTFVGFTASTIRLQTQSDWGWQIYGFYEESDEHNSLLLGYVSISKLNGADGVYELHNLAVLPEYRHKGCGKQLIDFCKAKIKELNGVKISIGITEENTVLKEWYAANGFIHTGTKKYDHMPITVGYMEWEVL